MLSNNSRGSTLNPASPVHYLSAVYNKAPVKTLNLKVAALRCWYDVSRGAAG